MPKQSVQALTRCVDGEQEEQGVRMGGFEQQLTKAEEERLEARAEVEEAVFQMYAERVVSGVRASDTGSPAVPDEPVEDESK